MQEIILKIERIVPEGKGVGTFIDGNGVEKKVYVLGAYPGELVKVEAFKQKKDFIEAKLIEVIEASPHRRDALEAHHVSHSPWQTIDYDYQIELKKDILKKCFESLAATSLEDIEIFQSPLKLGYRTKLEFSFDEEASNVIPGEAKVKPQVLEQTETRGISVLSPSSAKATKDRSSNQNGSTRGQIHLAFHERGSHKKMIRIGDEGCSLGNKQMNDYAFEVLKWINESGMEEFDLKSLVVRYSFYEDKVIGLLCVKNERERVQKALSRLTIKDISNLTIALSDHRSPMPKIDKILFQNGDDFLIEEIGGLKFKYYLDSFFQNNIQLFEKTLEKIKEYIRPSSKILELYSGVGTIGMNLASGSEIVGVEIIDSAVRAATENCQINELTNYRIHLLPSEKIDANLLDEIDCLIVDPPRTGLHQKLVKMIREKLPPQIIYLSCNPITQASDFNLIKDLYEIEYISGWDYYPNTPHLESLVVLKLKL